MREGLRWTGEISKVVISKSNGKWFASISVHLDDGNYKHQPDLFDAKQPIGIDVGSIRLLLVQMAQRTIIHAR